MPVGHGEYPTKMRPIASNLTPPGGASVAASGRGEEPKLRGPTRTERTGPGSSEAQWDTESTDTTSQEVNQREKNDRAWLALMDRAGLGYSTDFSIESDSNPVGTYPESMQVVSLPSSSGVSAEVELESRSGRGDPEVALPGGSDIGSGSEMSKSRTKGWSKLCRKRRPLIILTVILVVMVIAAVAVTLGVLLGRLNADKGVEGHANTQVDGAVNSNLNGGTGMMSELDEMSSPIPPEVDAGRRPDLCSGEGSGSNCSPDADCVNNEEGGFTCSCREGYHGDGITCADFDECAGEGSGNNCSPDADCINQEGRFTCSCKEGYHGDGITCTDFNECAGEDSGSNCSPNADCFNQDGGFICSCKEGYHGDGITCIDLDECIGEGGGSNCSANADCINHDGGFSCSCRIGFFGNPYDNACTPIAVKLSVPSHGQFYQESVIRVEGQVTAEPVDDMDLAVNGSPVVMQEDGTFFASIFLNDTFIFNEVKAELTHVLTGFKAQDKVVVVVGQSQQVGEMASQSAGIRITGRGLNTLEDVIRNNVEVRLSDLLPAGTRLVNNRCFQDACLPFIGCTCAVRGSVTVQRSSTSNSYNVDLGPNSISIGVNNLSVDLKIDTNTVDCDLRITANAASASGTYSLQPNSIDPYRIDVGNIRDVFVQFSSFDDRFTDGFCSFISPILDALIGDIESLAKEALEDFLEGDTIPMIIEDEIGQLVQLGVSVFSELGIEASTLFSGITQDQAGVTIAVDTAISTLDNDSTLPTLKEVLLIPQTFPVATLSSDAMLTPGGIDYGIALVVCDSLFNHVLAALVRNGGLNAEVTELSFGDTGLSLGVDDPVPITAGLLGFVLSPQFLQLPPAMTLTLQVYPTLAPALTGRSGELGEVAEIFVSHLVVDIVSEDTQYARMAIDMSTALSFEIDQATLDIVPNIKLQGNLHVTVSNNQLGIDEDDLEEKLAPYGPMIVPQLLRSIIPRFSLPANFLGVQLIPVEVSRVGECVGFFVSFQ